jgi:hypothetical protein
VLVCKCLDHTYVIYASGSGAWKRIQQKVTKQYARTLSSISERVYQAGKQVQGYIPDMHVGTFVKIRFIE